MADRIGLLGAVECVEVEVANPARIEPTAELGGDGRGNQRARTGTKKVSP